MFKGLNVIIRDDRNESGIAQGKIDNVSVLKPNTPAQQFVLTFQSTLDDGSQETFKSRLNTTEIEKFVSRQNIPAFDGRVDNFVAIVVIAIGFLNEAAKAWRDPLQFFLHGDFNKLLLN